VSRVFLVVPGQPSAVDELVGGIGRFSFKPAAELISAYPGAVAATAEQIMAWYEAESVTSPERITAEQFDDMLNVLPPINYGSAHDCLVFQMSEFQAGRVTGTYCRTPTGCWHWYDIARTPRHVLADKALTAARQDAELTELAGVLAGVG
jgi:hypothetical protein